MKEWRDIHFALALVMAFFVSRLMFFASGIRFFSDSVMYYIQYIDADLLKHDLLRSVFYFHYQPPLFNLMLGTVLKALPEHYGAFFGLAYWVMGLAMLLSLYFLMRAMSVPKPLSAVLAGIFSISPSCAAYEKTLFYTYPITLLLCLAALALYKYLSTKKIFFVAAFFSLLAAIILTGSMFHLVWFLFALGAVMVRDKTAWKRVLAAAAVPFLLVAAVYIKNYAVFGIPGTSSLAGFQLAMI
ncbi:MAG: hypothetical protein HQL30_07485, partial [Candidatus Omnitrophica bacterium]|nr:hypothetical protein [Candidatus Omnitrophota bacterium]